MLNTSKLGSNSKKDISKVFAGLRNYGFLVFNFNSNLKFNRGKMSGLCDHLIIGHKQLYFIEVKIGKDVLSDKQIALQSELLKTNAVYSIVTTTEEAVELKAFIIKNIKE